MLHAGQLLGQLGLRLHGHSAHALRALAARIGELAQVAERRLDLGGRLHEVVRREDGDEGREERRHAVGGLREGGAVVLADDRQRWERRRGLDESLRRLPPRAQEFVCQELGSGRAGSAIGAMVRR